MRWKFLARNTRNMFICLQRSACESARSLNSCRDRSLGTKRCLDHHDRHERVQDGFGSLPGEGHSTLCLIDQNMFLFIINTCTFKAEVLKDSPALNLCRRLISALWATYLTRSGRRSFQGAPERRSRPRRPPCSDASCRDSQRPGWRTRGPLRPRLLSAKAALRLAMASATKTR